MTLGVIVLLYIGDFLTFCTEPSTHIVHTVQYSRLQFKNMGSLNTRNERKSLNYKDTTRVSAS